MKWKRLSQPEAKKVDPDRSIDSSLVKTWTTRDSFDKSDCRNNVFAGVTPKCLNRRA